ncbi:hypothetical protein F8388_018797 [Cannabis sativa]|uniref:Transposase Tnp1/En/Spm-like domain-containing protein n=1 Tax=Cannabis sativa TaxID=3483 RepID=A0A7J6FJ06_CANSA|nr:hypothetical protein F8388_018797 [Cannabis sativa]
MLEMSAGAKKKYKDKIVYVGQWEKLIKYWTTDDAKVQLQEKQELNEGVSNEREAELKEVRSLVQANKQNYNANDTSIIPDMAKKPCMSHNKESRRQLWLSSSAYDIPIVESVTADPETIAIGLVVSKNSSKEVGGKGLGNHYSKVVVQIYIKPDEN